MILRARVVRARAIRESPLRGLSLFDTLIIGSGFAGFQAALTLAAAGKKVGVISTNSSATRYFSGAFDFLDDPSFSSPSFALNHPQSLTVALDSFMTRGGIHPYVALNDLAQTSGFSNQSLSHVLSGLAQNFFKALSIDVAGNGQDYLFGVAPSGILKPTAYLESSKDTSALFGQKTLIVGIEGLMDYSPLRLAQGLNHHIPCRAITVRLNLNYPRLLTQDVAHFLKTPAGLEELVSGISKNIQDEKFVLIPPVFLEQAELTKLEGRLGVGVRETLSLTPSLSGQRITQALESWLLKNVTVFKEAVVDYSVEKKRILSVKTASRDLPCRHVILATGKYLGGGISSLGKESLFGLPVYYGQKKRIPRTGNDDIGSSQEIFMAGVRTSPHLSPLGDDGKAAFGNLFAAGQILGGSDPAIDRSGFGVSLLSGHLAALQTL